MGRRRKEEPNLGSFQNIPDFVLVVRKKIYLSQEDFGNLLGVTRIAVHNWEKGVSEPNRVHFEMIRCFSKIKTLPAKSVLRTALVSGGSPFALYLLLKSAFERG